MPARWKRETKKGRLDDFACAVGTKEPVHQQEFASAVLRGLHHLRFAAPVQFIEPQPLQDADGAMYRRMSRPVVSATVPPTVGHLLSEQVIGERFEPLVVVLEVAEDGEHHAGDARLTAPSPSVVYSATPPGTPPPHKHERPAPPPP